MFLFVVGLIIGLIVGIIIWGICGGHRLRKILKKTEDNSIKMYEFYLILLQWLRVHKEGKTLEKYFLDKNYNTIAIYGMKELGEALLDELGSSHVDVKYGIDMSADDLYVALDMYKPTEELPEVDVVVVTAVHYYDAIEDTLKSKMTCDIVSLEDVVWEA